MKKTKLSILLLVMVMILAISAVSAADVTESDDLGTAQDEAVTIEAANDIDDTVSVDNEGGSILKDSSKSFTDLRNDIDNGGSEIKLNSSYKYDADADTIVAGDPWTSKTTRYTEGILITKNCTIDGQGNSIDGSDSARIFRIFPSAHVTLKNIVFKNAKTDLGAIYYALNDLTLQNCTFIFNGATYDASNATISNGPVIKSPNQYDETVIVIDDEASYNAQLNDPLSLLNAYYYRNPREDGIDVNGDLVSSLDTMIVGHSWNATLHANTYPDKTSTLPWVLVNTASSTDFAITYDGEMKAIDGVPEGKVYYLGSVPNDLGMTDYRLEWGTGAVLDKAVDDSKVEVTYVEYKSFSDLRAAIDAANPNDVITLTDNYAYAGDDSELFNNVVLYKDGVFIFKNLTIDAAGHILNAGDANRVFRVYGFANVTIKNAVFVNGKGASGKAIYSHGYLTFENCTFIEGANTYDDASAISSGSVYSDVVTDRFTLITNESTFEAAMADPASSLNRYYYAFPREDGVDENGTLVTDSNTVIVGHTWSAAINAPTTPAKTATLPWVAANLLGYKGELVFAYDGVLQALGNVPGTWSVKIYSIPNGLGMTEYRLEWGTGQPLDKTLDPAEFNVIANKEAFIPDIDTDVPLDYGNDVIVNVTVPENYTGIVELFVDGVSQGILTFTNGVSNDNNLGMLDGGKHNITIICPEDANYVPVDPNTYVIGNITKTITVRVEPTFTVTVEDIAVGENATVYVNLNGTNGVGTADVEVIVNNKRYTINVVDGEGNKTIEGLTQGSYPVTASFAGNDEYIDAIASTIFNVKYGNTILDNDLDVNGYDYGSFEIEFYLIGDDGNDITGIVDVTIDGNPYTVSVISGVGTLTVDDKYDVGTHDLVAEFNGDSTYNATKLEQTLKINPKKVYVDVDTDSGVNYQGIGQILVALEDENGDLVYDIIELILTDSNGVEVGRIDVETTNERFSRNEIWNDLPFTSKLPIGDYTITFNAPNYALEMMDEIYNFTSYSDAGKSVTYGTGTVKIDGGHSWIEAKVLTNSPDSSFENRYFYINGDDANDPSITIYELYEYDDDADAMNPTGIFVEVSKVVLPVEFEYSVHKIYIDDVKVTEGEGWYLYRTEHNVTLVLNGPERYTFISYGDAGKTVTYGAGLVEITDEDGDWIEVRVLLNDFDDSFIGKYFYVNKSDIGNDPIELYEYDDVSDANVPTRIYVEISKVEINCNTTIEIGIADDNGEFDYNDYINAKFEDGKVTVDLTDLGPGDYRLRVSLDDDMYEVVSWDDENIINYIELKQRDDYCLFFVQNDDISMGDVNGAGDGRYRDERIFNFTLSHGYWDDNIYKFVSYGDDQGLIKYGTGFVKINGDNDNGYTPVIVLSNDFDDSFVGLTFYIDESAQPDGATFYEIYDDQFNALGIFVKVYDDHEFREFFNYTTQANVTIYTDDQDVFVMVGTALIDIIDGVSDSIDLTNLPAGYYKITVKLEDPYYAFEDNDDGQDVDYAVMEFNIESDVPHVQIIEGTQGTNYGQERLLDFSLVHWDGNQDVVFVYDTNVNVTIFKVIWNETTQQNTYELLSSTLVAIKDGYLTEALNLTNLNASNYKVTFKLEDPYYAFEDWDDGVEVDYQTEWFNVNRANANIQFDVPHDITYGDDLTFTINITGVYGEALNETVHVFIENYNFDNDIVLVDGFNSTTIDDLTVGSYVAFLYFHGTDNYNGDYGNWRAIKVNKADPQITITDIAGKYGETVDANVTIAGGDAAGYVIYDGVSYAVVNGETTIPVKLLTVGDNTITVTYTGDDNYNNKDADKQFTVENSTLTFTVDATQDAAYHDYVTITVTSDVDGTAHVTVVNNDVYSNAFDINIVNGVGTYVLADLIPENYTVSANYTVYGYDKATGDKTFEVVKAAATFTAEGIDATYGENATVFVSDLPIDATGTVTVTINGKPYTANVESGNALVQIPGLAAGLYELFAVEYSGDDNYTGHLGMATFTVKPATSSVVIDDVADVTYNASVEVTYNVENETALTIVVKDANGNEITSGVNTTAAGKVTISGLNAGQYTISVSNAALGNYSESSAEQKFNVLKATAIIDPVTEGEVVIDGNINVTFTLPGDIDGAVIVTADGASVTPEKVGDKYIVPFVGLTAGSHTVVVKLTGDTNYEDAIGEVSFTVDKITPQINIVVDNKDNLVAIAYSNITVTVDGGKAAGKILVEGLEAPIYIDDFTGVWELDPLVLLAGDYNITVTYFANDNYNEATSNVEFTVAKGIATVEISNVTTPIPVGEDATFDVVVVSNSPDGANGNITIYIDGIENQTVVLDPDYGNATVVIPGLANGTYTIGVKYNGDENFIASEVITTQIAVNKVETYEITADNVVIDYGENATIVVLLPMDANDGIASVVINGTTYTDNVVYGIAYIVGPDDLAVGNYTVEVTYTGGSKYADASLKVNVTVIVGDPGFDANIVKPAIKYEENATIEIIINDSATGEIDVYDNGEYYYTFDVSDARANGIEIPLLTAGDHTITLAYLGDGKFTPANATVDVTVEKIIPEISANATKGAHVGDNITINVDVSGYPNGNVSITVDSVEVYNGETDHGGLATVEVSGLAAGDHVFVVKYLGDENYYPNTYANTFNITKYTPEITIVIDDIDNLVALAYTNLTVTVGEGKATGKLLIDGLDSQIFVEDFTGVFVLDPLVLGAGDYDLKVTYLGDDTYDVNSNSVQFTVVKGKATPKLSDITSVIVYGENASFVVNMISDTPNAATGNVTIYINGTEYKVVALDDEYNNATVVIPGLNNGIYDIGVKYNGNDILKESITVRTSIIVKQAPSVIVINPIADVDYGNPIVIEYSITPGSDFDTIEVFNVINEDITYDATSMNDTTLVYNLPAGKYKIVIHTPGDNQNYGPAEASAIFTVNRINPAFNSTVSDNITVGKAVTVTVYAPADATGRVNFTVDNQFVDFKDLVNGSAVFTISGLSTGHYSYKVTYEGDLCYIGPVSDIQSFDVVKEDISGNVTIDVNTPANSTDTVFTINVPEDATGYLLVDVDGKNYYATVENGTASVTVPALVPGNYSANITYTGDDKYDSVTKETAINVPSNVPDNALTIPETSETSSPTYSIKLPSDATGYLTVDVDGIKYVAGLVNGSASVTVPEVSEGKHNVTVTYSGDAKYSAVIKNTALDVHIPVYELKGKNVNVVYSAKGTYKVLVTKDGVAVGAGEKVTVKFNGKTKTVKTDGKGYATYKFTAKLKVKKYTITATYNGVTTKNTVKVTHVIKASNKKVKKSKSFLEKGQR